MDWQNERYVRSYTRDTVTRKVWTWEARAIWDALMRKVDRAGVIDIGEHEPAAAVAAMVDIPVEVVSAHLPAILKSKAVALLGQCLVMPNFVEAQEANQSDKQRQSESRARRLDKAMRGDLLADVTKRDEMSHAVTASHSESHDVTPSLAVPSLAKPSQAKNKASAPPARTRSRLPPSPQAIEIAQHLFDSISAHSAHLYQGDSPAQIEKRLNGWTVHIGRAIKHDAMTVGGARLCIDYAHHESDPSRSGSFSWYTNLLSGQALRKQWQQKKLLADATRWRDAPKAERPGYVPPMKFTEANARVRAFLGED